MAIVFRLYMFSVSVCASRIAKYPITPINTVAMNAKTPMMVSL